MQNNWTFGGIRLSAFGAVTELNSYLDIPAKRGGNITIPYKHGQVWVPKYYDSRIISFGIEIIAGTITELEDILDDLKTLVGSRQQQALVNSDWNGVRRSAQAEVMNNLGLTRDPDPLVAKVVLDFFLADPFFRQATMQTFGPQIIDASPKTFTIPNPGTAEERKAVITLTGPLSHPIITNLENSVAFQFDDVLAANTDIVTIDCDDFTAIDETAANVVNKIIHTGDTCFMVFIPGDNDMSVTDGTHTTGTIQVDWYPAYL